MPTNDPNATSTLKTTTTSNPVEDNFEFVIKNSFRCGRCGSVTQIEERLLCLETSISVGRDEANADPSLTSQRVLDDYFGQERVEKRCDHCGANEAVKTVSVKK